MKEGGLGDVKFTLVSYLPRYPTDLPVAPFSPHLKSGFSVLFCRLYFAATSGVCLIRSGAPLVFSKETTFAKIKERKSLVTNTTQGLGGERATRRPLHYPTVVPLRPDRSSTAAAVCCMLGGDARRRPPVSRGWLIPRV